MPRTVDYYKGKTIVITGAGSGIGRATAKVFGREGANVVATDIDVEGAERTANEVIQIGAKATFARCDVTVRAEVDAALKHAVEDFGRLHFALNSAGGAMGRRPFLDIDQELWERTYALHVRGTFNGCQAIIPHMLEEGGGVIVNIASVAAWIGGAGNSVHYASSKGAVNTMSMGIGREFASRNIRCLSISPGLVDSPFHDDTPKEVLDNYAAQIPMDRMALPEEIAETVLFACSDAASYLTADTIKVSGGIR